MCNQHEWVHGRCAHEDIADDSDHNLPYFDQRDKDFQVLQEVVLAPTLLASLKYYVNFRLEIENYLSWFWRVALSCRSFRERMEYSTYYCISLSYMTGSVGIGRGGGVQATQQVY